MRRALHVGLALGAALIAGVLLAGPVSARVPDQAPTPVPAPAPASAGSGPSVRVLAPEVRALTPEVRSLRQETVQGPRTTVTISSDVLFDFDSADLTPAARRVVDVTGTKLAAKPGTITVVGHTDGIGTQAYNQTLSEKRAAAVALQLKPLVGGRTITTAGRSFTEPVAPETRGGEDNPAGRALNRRVVITVG